MKISPEFAARLERRKPDEMVRAVLMLDTQPPVVGAGRRELRARRSELTEAARRSVQAALEDINKILDQYDGHCLENTNLGALGGIAVETTPAGIKALAERPKVRAIVEDQSISLIEK